MPWVSTLVFYHRHRDQHIAKQSAGRAQRVGRAYSLEVIEILDETENARR